MPVSTPHTSYTYRKADWAKVRDFAEGARKVKALGTTYLPKPSGWDDKAYDAYKARAEVYGAVDRTIDGLDGGIFRKPPVPKVPKSSEDLIQDVTLSNKTLVEFSRDLVREILTVGRGGILVDFTGDAKTQANTEARVSNGVQRSYIVRYAAEQIINWEEETIGGVTKTTLVVLEESYLEPTTDPFVKASKVRYRVLRLVGNVYRVELWQTKTAGDQTPGSANGVQLKPNEVEYEKVGEFIPSRRGTTLDKIPFFFVGVSGQSAAPEKPPLLDIADLCILHYMTSADYAHGLHWVGLPTPWATGVSDTEKGNLGIGPSSAWIFSAENAKVGMLEFTGQGLNAVKDRLEGLERKMAALGARILEEQKRQAESGDALKLRQSGDASVLAGISDAVSRSIEAAVRRMIWWNGTESEEPEVSFALNMDFFASAMDPQLLVALLQAWQAGGISKDTFIHNLQRGEMLPEGRTVEEEIEKISTEAPPGMPENAPPAGGKDQ